MSDDSIVKRLNFDLDEDENDFQLPKLRIDDSLEYQQWGRIVDIVERRESSPIYENLRNQLIRTRRICKNYLLLSSNSKSRKKRKLPKILHASKQRELDQCYLLRNIETIKEKDENPEDLHSDALKDAFKQLGIIRANKALDINRGNTMDNVKVEKPELKSETGAATEIENILVSELNESLQELSQKLDTSENGVQLMNHVISCSQLPINDLYNLSVEINEVKCNETIKEELFLESDAPIHSQTTGSQMPLTQIEDELLKIMQTQPCPNSQQRSDICDNEICSNIKDYQDKTKPVDYFSSQCVSLFHFDLLDKVENEETLKIFANKMIENPTNYGFEFASGKAAKFNENMIDKLKREFDLEEKNMKFSQFNETSSDKCQTIAGNTLLSPKSSTQNTAFANQNMNDASKIEPTDYLSSQYDAIIDFNLLDKIEHEESSKFTPNLNDLKTKTTGFEFASGKNIKLNQNIVLSFKRRFDQEEKNMKIHEIEESTNDLGHITVNSTLFSPKTPLQSSTPIMRRTLQNNQLKNDGFALASGKNLEINQREVFNYKRRFNQEENNMKFDEIDETSNDFFQITTNTTLLSPKTPLQTSTPIIRRTLQKLQKTGPNFALASGKDIEINQNAFSNFKKRFDKEDENMSLNIEINKISNDSYQFGATSDLYSPKISLQTSTPIVHRTHLKAQTTDFGFTLASGKNIEIDQNAVSNFKRLFDREENNMKLSEINEKTNDLYKFTANDTLKHYENTLKNASEMINDKDKLKQIDDLSFKQDFETVSEITNEIDQKDSIYPHAESNLINQPDGEIKIECSFQNQNTSLKCELTSHENTKREGERDTEKINNDIHQTAIITSDQSNKSLFPQMYSVLSNSTLAQDIISIIDQNSNAENIHSNKNESVLFSKSDQIKLLNENIEDFENSESQNKNDTSDNNGEEDKSTTSVSCDFSFRSNEKTLFNSLFELPEPKRRKFKSQTQHPLSEKPLTTNDQQVSQKRVKTSNELYIEYCLMFNISAKKPKFNDFPDDEDFPMTNEEIHEHCKEIERIENIRFMRATELKKQIDYYQNKPDEDKRSVPGRMLIIKSKPGRLKLTDLHSSSKLKLKNSMIDHCVPYERIDHYLFDMSKFTSDPKNVICVALAENAKLVFNPKHSGMVGFNEIKYCFLAMKGVDPQLVSDVWFKNAYEMIFWKLMSMELFFEKVDKDEVLNPENLLFQLKYRYDREIDKNERPFLRKMVEGDEIAARRVVLKVSHIWYTPHNGYELELTDGWYKVKALVDPCIADAIAKHKIVVHSKLLISNMEIITSIENKSILDFPEHVRVKIHGNSSRLVKWNTRLGCCKCPSPFKIPLDSVKSEGGMIGKLELVIIHVYNPIYVESNGNKREYRSEKMQNRIENQNEINLSAMYERIRSKIMTDIQTELGKRYLKIKENFKNKSHLTLHEVCDVLEVDRESEFAMKLLDQLSNTEVEQVNEIHAQRRFDLDMKIKEIMKGEESKKVSQVLKFRVADASNPKAVGLISCWHPSEELFDIVKQGKMIALYRAHAEKNFAGLNICMYRDTIMKELKIKPDLTKIEPFFRKETKFKEIDENFLPMFNEFDLACVIVHISQIKNDKQTSQEVFVADEHMNFVALNFYINITEYAYDDVLKEGRILYVRNLQWRKSFRNLNMNIPEAYAISDITTFVTTSGKQNEKERLIELEGRIKENPNFFDECKQKLVSLVGPIKWKDDAMSKKETGNTSLLINNSILKSDKRVELPKLPKKFRFN